jgi:L-threonylcarbamoyladenylate synthase
VVVVGEDGVATLLRPGAIAREELEKCLGAALQVARPGSRQQAPGQLASHSAPRTPLMVLRGDTWPLATGPVGLLVMSGDADARAAEASRRLGVPVTAVALGRDLAEIARNLFKAMRELDEMGLSLMLAEPSPSMRGLGYAIADRLARAAART